MHLLLFNSSCVGSVQVSIYLSVSAFHWVSFKLKRVGLLLEYNGKIYIGLDSPVGIPVVEVYNLLGRAQSALWRGVLPFSTAFHWV